MFNSNLLGLLKKRYSKILWIIFGLIGPIKSHKFQLVFFNEPRFGFFIFLLMMCSNEKTILVFGEAKKVSEDIEVVVG